MLPGRAIPAVARGAGWLGYRCLASRRQVVERNIGRILGDSVLGVDIGRDTSRLARIAFTSYARYWIDAFRLPITDTALLSTAVAAEGVEWITEARQAGKGFILALPHLGNWDVAGAWLVHTGIPLTVVVERLEPPELFTWFEDFRKALGLTVVVNEVGISARLLAALERNEGIALMSDRDLDGSGADVRFFNEATRLPKGPAVIALRSGAPILPAAVFENNGIESVGYKKTAASHRIIIGPPLAYERRARLGADVERITQDLAYHLEEFIRMAPEQWHVFQPNWPADAAPPAKHPTRVR